MKSLQERFDEKWCPEPNSGCWLWTGAVTSGGYGWFRFDRSGMAAHRASWILHRGTIPNGMHVCHTCDTRSCVNPDHLWLGTHKSNMEDCSKKGRIHKLHGVLQPQSKLSDGDVVAIRDAHEQRAYSQTELALRYGVSVSNINQIVLKRTWTHIL